MMQSSSRIVTGSNGEKQLISFCKTQQKIVKQTVRSEDDYLEHLGTIIQRDFFPDLTIMKGEKPSNYSNPGNDSVRFPGSETPTRLPTQNPEHDPAAMSLDKYLANNTTEDNASFTEIIDESNKKRGAKLSEFFPSRSTDQKLSIAAGSDQMLSLTDDSNASTSKRDTTGQTDSMQQSLTEPSTSNCHSLTELISHNTVHFCPDGAPPTALELTEHFNRERRICVVNSRFKKPLFCDKRKLFGPSGAFHKTGRIGIDGKEHHMDSPLATPQAGGYRFMDSSPSPAFGSEAGTPLITWGEVDSTPYRLDERPSTSSLHFRIPSPSEREALAHNLADKAGRQRAKGRADAVKLAKSGLVSPYSSKVALSPAARRLLSKTSGKSGLLSGFLGSSHSRVSSSRRPTDLVSPAIRPLSSDLGIIHRRPTTGQLVAASCSTPSRDNTYTSQSTAVDTSNLLNLSGGQK